MTQISCFPHWFFPGLNRRGRYCTSQTITKLFELIPAVDHAEKLIRDAKDQPILNAAIVSDVDIILTGDKDFLSLEMEHPKCMTVAQFFESEGVEE